MATPDPSDKGADNFKGVTSHRAGYAFDPIANALYWARKGGTLQAGEGALLVQEIERLTRELREALQELAHAERAIAEGEALHNAQGDG